MIIEDFMSKLEETVFPGVEKCMSVYWTNVYKRNIDDYQYGKMVEEIGELISALASNKICNLSYLKDNLYMYDRVRGTIESEASDVILSSIGILINRCSKIERCKMYDHTAPIDKELLMSRLVKAIDNSAPSTAISAVFSYFYGREEELLLHINTRLKFNLDRIKEGRIERTKV